MHALVSLVVLAGCGGEPAETDTSSTRLQAYGDAWNEADPVERDRLLELSTVEGIVVLEPTRTLGSRAEVSAAIAQFLRDVPGGSLVLRGEVRDAHARTWLGWEAFDGGGASLAIGFDLMFRTSDARIERVHSFFGTLPAPGAMDAVQQAFLDAWNEEDEAARMAALGIAVSDEARVAIEGEPMPLVGRAAIAEHIGSVQRAMPGRRVEAESGFLALPGAWQTTWRVIGADGSELGSSPVFAYLDGEGLIVDAVVFSGGEGG